MSMLIRRRFLHSTAIAAAITFVVSATATSAQERTFEFDIPAESLSKSLRDFGRATHQQLIFTENLTSGKSAPPITGELSGQAAMDMILSGSGLSAQRTAAGALIIQRGGEANSPQSGNAGARANTSGNSSSGVTTDVQEVIVTANKRDERLHNVAMGITAVTGNDLQTRQELDFTEFAAQVPGFNVESAGFPGWDREILRGLNSGGTGATVATIIDEMPLSFSGATNNAGVTSTKPDSYDLQRVEVLKGPQGTLYGATAEGGAVKYVTTPPDLAAFHAGAEVGASGVDHGGTGGSGKGFVNIPFWQDKAALRVTGYYEDIPGYIDDPNLNEHDVNRTDRYGARATLLAKPTSDLSVRFSVSHQETHYNDFGYEQVVGTGLAPSTSPNRFNLVDGYSFSDALPENGVNVVNYYIGNIEYDFHWAKFSSITSYGTVKNTFNRDDTILQAGYGLSYGNYFGKALFGHPVGLAEQQLESLNKFNQEFRISSEPDSTIFGQKIDWIGGVYLTRENVRFNQIFNFETLPTATTASTIIPSPVAGGAEYPTRFEEGAVFGQVDYHLTPRIDIALGGRISYDVEQLQSTLFCCVIASAKNVSLPKYKNNEQPKTWSVSPRWQITDTTLAYLRFATGYRPGGPNTAPASPPPGYHYYYQSDSTMNYEGGIRSEFFNHLLTVDVAAFHIDWNNIQILSHFVATNGVSYGATGNAGTAESTGLEYTLGLHPLRGLTFTLLGSYTDAHLTQDASGLGAFKGQALPYVPKWNNTLDLDYQWRIAEGYRAYVGGVAVFEGSRFTDFSTSALSDPHTKLPSYQTLALQAGVKTGPYTFEAYAKNVTDSKGISYYNGSGGYNYTGLAELITPRTVGLRIAVDY